MKPRLSLSVFNVATHETEDPFATPESTTIVHSRRRAVYDVQVDAAVLGDRLPEVTQKPFLGPKKPLFAVPALRELESACRVSIL